MANIADAEDAVLEGQADFEAWVAQFVAEWFEPLTEMVIAATMASIPPAVKAQMNPDDLALVDGTGIGGI